MSKSADKKLSITAFIEDLKKRWSNINELSKKFPGEGLILSYCFTEAMGYWRFDHSENKVKLNRIEQFVKVLHDYQSNKMFMNVPYIFVKETPMEKEKRTIGANISNEILIWLKTNIPVGKDHHVATIWEQLPAELKLNKYGNFDTKYKNIYELTWAGYFYGILRTAGVHRGNYYKGSVEEDLNDIIRANNEILTRLEEDCVKNGKFPYELEQLDSLYHVIY